ncbi:sulfotransferase family 2 domain-containing protein [Cognatilysobacter tabacisoli]|uniref:sulfotransferase family 2 domain-containing protein n=1 Tax=Cognatilysobacter tabacisoli TaxID=2315424 RepID=UPI000E6B3CC2|nr:sulfotransferase family 2 domain-containing protein [Lysobacter tabacisoli]
MIVSHQHRYIFVPMPKTGTHSVRQALREHLGPDDIEQVGLFVNKRFPFDDIARIKHGHLSVRQVRPYLGDEVADAYFKFTFVRNPFDRFVSYCSFMTRQTGAFDRDPKGTMRRILFEARPLDHVHFQPQYTLLVNDAGDVEMDYLGRVETMQASYDAICERVGIPSRALDRVNSSRRGHYREYYDADLVDGVAALYRRDLELFDYQF